MEKSATDHSCLWILFCALDYHRSERERGAALQLHNSPTTLLWPAYLNSLTLVTLCRDECAYMLRLLASGRERALPSMRSFPPFYYIHRNSGPPAPLEKKKGKKKQQETCTPHEQLGKKRRAGRRREKKKETCTPHEQRGWFETWMQTRLYVFFIFPAFGNMNQFRFHLAINQDPYRVLPISVFTMYNNRKAYFY